MGEEAPSTPPEVKLSAIKAIGGLVPQKTQAQYLAAYQRFQLWLDGKGTTKISENTLLAYFQELLAVKKPTTLWSEYSFLKKMIRVNHSIDIGQFLSVSDLLKQKTKTHSKKKAATFTSEEIDKYLSKAPDTLQFVQDKLAFLISLFGGLRSEETCRLDFKDLEEFEDHIKVTISSRKTDQAANGTTFFVTASKESFRYPLHYLRKYKQAFSKIDGPLFRQIKNDKVTAQKRGKGYFYELPKRIAEFLQLENTEKYTGHAIRRTATTWLAERGVTATVLQKFGGWKSSSVAQEYVDDTDTIRKTIADAMQNESVSQVTLNNSTEKSLTSGITINAKKVIIKNSFNTHNKE
jgi:integrase